MRLIVTSVITLLAFVHPTPAGAEELLKQVYWIENSGLYRAGPTGEGVEAVVTSGAPTSVAVDDAGGKIYWTSGFGGPAAVWRANLDGTAAELLTTAVGIAPYSIALDVAGGKVYWGDLNSNDVRRANLDGSNPEILLTEPFHVLALELDVAGGTMYWTAGGSVRRANLDGSEATTISSEGSEQLALDPVHGKVYWASPTFNTLRIRRSNLDGSAPATVYETQYSFSSVVQVLGMAAAPDQGLLFWTEHDGLGAPRIAVVGLDGEDPKTLVERPAFEMGLHVGPPHLPGSGDDLRLLTGVNVTPTPLDVKPIGGGDDLNVWFGSPGDTLNPYPHLLVGQFFPSGSPPPVTGLPELHVNPFAGPLEVLYANLTPSIFGPPKLSTHGVELAFPVTVNLTGWSMRLQAASLAGPVANNGSFAITDAHEIVFGP